jgi:fumarate reductase subunit D
LPFLDYFHQQTTESYPSEIVLLSFFYVVIGLILLATYSLWLKTKGERVLATIVTTYLLTEYWAHIIKDFNWLRNIIGSTLAAVIIPVVVYILVGLIAIGLRSVEIKIEEKKWSEHPIETIAKFACVVIFVLNSYALTTYLQKRHAVDAYKQPAIVGGVSSIGSAKGRSESVV